MNDQFTLPIEDLFEDERRIRKAKAQEEIERRERHMKVVLSIPEGRAIIYWIIEQGGFFRPSYNGKSLDLAKNSASVKTPRRSWPRSITSSKRPKRKRAGTTLPRW
jgi:hypothetical protein